MRNRQPHGFTLLELVLALALAALVLYAVTMAVSLHLRMSDAGRTDVEEAALARALLKQIAADLRGAVRYDPLDAENGPTGSAAASGGEDDRSGAGDDQSGDPLDSPETDDEFGSEQETGYTEDIAQSSAPCSVPGIAGNSSQIQVDVARLPRADQFRKAAVADEETTAHDLVSDVKTVAYFVVTPGTVEAGSGIETRSGLIRRELDRAVTSHAAQSGRLLNVELDLEPIAPEVKSIEFRYYDGTEWVDSWDTEQQKRLPLAVDIAIAVGRIRHESQRLGSWTGSAEEERKDDKTVYYRLLVDLPASAPAGDAGATGATQGTSQGTANAADNASQAGANR